MAISLVGSIGAVSQGSVSASVTPSWGTSETRAGNNLLICFVSVNGVATAPSISTTGWNTAVTKTGTSCAVGIFYKVAAGSDTAPTVNAITSAVISAQLAEYSGAAATSPVDRYGSNSGTTSPVTATTGGTDATTGELIITSNTAYYSKSRAPTLSTTLNNATDTETENGGTSTQYHYDFSYGLSTSNSAADNVAFSFTTLKITGVANAIASFKILTQSTKTQTASARIQLTGQTMTQPATARIQKTGQTMTQPATARIQKTGQTKTQTATARIQKTNQTKTQPATANIVSAGVIQSYQTATASIRKTGLTKTQPATARIQKTGLTKTQTAIARIQLTGQTMTQSATAKILIAGVVDVNLGSPDDGATVHNGRPTLYFTGQESSSNNLEYDIQIDTTNTFNSSTTGQPLISKYSDGLINYRATGIYDSAGSTAAVVAAPTGLSDGDLVFVSIRRDAAVDPSDVPSGWNLLQSVLSTYGFWLYYKVASSEGSSWTWTWAASSKTQGYAYAFWGDFNPNNPIQNSTTPYSGTGNRTTIDIPTLTTSADNTLSIILSSAYSTSAKTFTVPTSPSYTEQSDTGSTNPDFWQAVASYVYPTASTATGTISYPAGGNCTYRIGCQILINPNPNTGFQSGHPYNSGQQVYYTLPSVLASKTYYWRVRAKAPAGTNTYNSWTTRSFIIKDGAKVWTGSAWAYKPVKVWSGSEWQALNSVKIWDGSQWVEKG